MKPLGHIPLSETLKHFYSTHDISRQSKIVIDSAKFLGYDLFLRECSDFDTSSPANSNPAEFISDWNSLIYCDYKVRINHNLNIKLLLERFTLNRQLTKVLHISLDDPGINAELLIKSIPALDTHGKLLVEINDRTGTIDNPDTAKTFVRMLKFKVAHVYYWNSRLQVSDSYRGYGFELTSIAGHPEYF